MFHFPTSQVTTFQNIEGMLEKVHLVAEGTLIYLSETSEVFIRIRNGWRKLQVLLHYVLIFSNSLTQNGVVALYTGGEVQVQGFLFLVQKLMVIRFHLLFILGSSSLVS